MCWVFIVSRRQNGGGAVLVKGLVDLGGSWILKKKKKKKLESLNSTYASGRLCRFR
jgi:lipoate-protein ligase A